MSTIALRKTAPIAEPSPIPDFSSLALQSLGCRILELLFLIRSSGHHVYRQELGLKEIEQRLIGALGRLGPLTSLQLANAVGIGKPQTSRATTELTAAGLIRRPHHRAAFELTPDGDGLFRRMLALFETRRAQVVAGVDEAAQQFLSEKIAVLMRLGEEWLATEQRLSACTAMEEPMMSSGYADLADLKALIPSLVTMSILMQRSAFLLWKRTIGVAPFDWMVLSRVAEAGRLSLYRLPRLTARDKSQVWRTVGRLVDEGLLVRHFLPMRREVELTVSPEGERIYRISAHHTIERDKLIMAALGPESRDRFKAIVERMIINAQQLMHHDADA